jgi:diaminopimelate decarboxylase
VSALTQAHDTGIGGCGIETLRRQFGTPLLVIDGQCFRESIRSFRAAFTRPGWSAHVTYAGKALLLREIARIACAEGLDIDVCSAGEFETALSAGVPPERCIFHGCYKTDAELDMAVERRAGRIVIDHHAEISALAARAQAAGTVCDVLVRVNPNVPAGVHESVQTAGGQSKFGFTIEDGQALDALQAVQASPQLRLRGIHCHIGSQITDLAPYRLEVSALVAFAQHSFTKCAIKLPLIDVGGGLGVRGPGAPNAIGAKEWADAIFDAFDEALKDGPLGRPAILVEPGRALVAAAGTTLYSIGVRKRLASGTQALIVDGGLSDNPRPALYEASYDVDLISPPRTAQPEAFTVFGRHCETDRLFKDVRLRDPQPGDILAVRGTGAYTYSMASNYNRFARPAVVLAADGVARLIARREPLEHVLDLDASPTHGERAAAGSAAPAP